MKDDSRFVYIKKSEELIKSIPEIKNEILNLRERLTVHTSKEDLARLKILTAFLQYLINCLSKIGKTGKTGEILIDVYFSGLSRSEVARKYNYDACTIGRILRGEMRHSLESWTTLSILLYGIEAVRLEA